MKKENLKTESGRSMVEMLGVLAIVGVLSVGGVYGYGVAMKKHKANQLLHEASMHAATVSAQIMSGKDPTDLTDFGTGNTITLDTDSIAGNTTFKLKMAGIGFDVCTQMKNSKGGMVRDVTCDEATGDATITYYKNLATDPAEGEKSPTGGEPCTLTADDCLSKALVEGECACAPATDETECTSWTTNECGKGKYCVFSVNSCTTDPTTGVCKPVSYIEGEKTATVETNGEDVEYTMSACSNNCPDWWSAQSWCKAHGKTMVSLSDVHCTSSGCTDTLWRDLGNALYRTSSWVTDTHDSGEAFFVYLGGGNVGYNCRYVGVNVLCW